jgi:ubiquitin fusion degradation protein 1
MFGRFHGGGNRATTFEAKYRAYPVSFIDRADCDKGDKIILPPSALDRITQTQQELDFPMLFELENERVKRVTNSGVLEFIADEGVCYLPYWMMENLQLKEGEVIKVKSKKLPKGTFVKLQPQTSDFLNISNPKAVLETCLRNYTCLTVGDTFMIEYNNKRFFIDVVEAKPANGVCVVETDCEVDFAPPLDYVEPDYLGKNNNNNSMSSLTNSAKNKNNASDQELPKLNDMDIDDNGTIDLTGDVKKKNSSSSLNTAAAGAGEGAQTQTEEEKEDEAKKNTFLAFAGKVNRLDGKAPKIGESKPVVVELPTTSMRVTKEWEKLREGGVLGDASGSESETKKKTLSEAERNERKQAGKVMFNAGGARAAAMARKKQKETEQKEENQLSETTEKPKTSSAFDAFKGSGNKLR